MKTSTPGSLIVFWVLSISISHTQAQVQTFPFVYNSLDYQGNDDFINSQSLGFPFNANGAGYGAGPGVGHGTGYGAGLGIGYGASKGESPVRQSAFNSVFRPDNNRRGKYFSYVQQYGLQMPLVYPSSRSTNHAPAPSVNNAVTYQKNHDHYYKKTKTKKKMYKPKNKRKFRKRKFRKRKSHTISYQLYPGFSIIGGSQIHGKVWSLHACKSACKKAPDCFAGDYNKHLKRCYLHSNTTACLTMQTDHPVVHFQKVPCVAPETTNGRVMLGVQLFGGIETKAKSIVDCIHSCANMGSGIAKNIAALAAGFKQICAAIDYDFSTKKCYIHGDTATLCPATQTATPPALPLNLVKNPTVVNVLLCPPLT